MPIGRPATVNTLWVPTGISATGATTYLRMARGNLTSSRPTPSGEQRGTIVFYSSWQAHPTRLKARPTICCSSPMTNWSQDVPALSRLGVWLPGRKRRYGFCEARGVRGRAGQTLAGDRPGLVQGLGTCRAILCLRTRHPQNDLQHERG